jgi:hypothetical protein
MPLSGSGYGGGEPVRPSSEAEPHPRGRPALERGGASPEGRLALERGGASPEGRLALERGGASPEGVSRPRARRILTRGGTQSSSEAEVC